MVHCITSSKLDGKRVCFYASDVDVAVLLITHCNLLSCRNIYFGVSAEKTNIDILLEIVGSELAKCLLTLHCLTGCDTVGKFHNASKKSWRKLFLLMHSHFHFWSNLYHVTARTTARNLALVNQMSKTAPTCVNMASSIKTEALHYLEQHLKKITNFKKNLVNLQ